MYIRELNKSDKYYYCSEKEGKYLIKRGLPLLSRDGDKMVFAKTPRLEEELSNLPIILKLLKKVGEKSGK